jgi:hypothetical protein
VCSPRPRICISCNIRWRSDVFGAAVVTVSIVSSFALKELHDQKATADLPKAWTILRYATPSDPPAKRVRALVETRPLAPSHGLVLHTEQVTMPSCPKRRYF